MHRLQHSCRVILFNQVERILAKSLVTQGNALATGILLSVKHPYKTHLLRGRLTTSHAYHNIKKENIQQQRIF